MAGAISIKRIGKGRYSVQKRGAHVADIRRSGASEKRHDPDARWLLQTVSGRIDRFVTKGEAVEDAYKL